MSRKPIKELTRIASSEHLLDEERRATLINEIKGICALEEARFKSICLVLIHNLANHCQYLPETANSYYSQPGGILDHALNRAEAALSLFRSQLLLEDSGELSEEQSLWQYALFSAAILQGIGKLQVDFKISLYESSGQPLKEWAPLLESLTTLGKYYDYEFKKESDRDFRCRLNLLLARLLMPASGFSWIASNEQVLAVWLALINENYQDAGVLGVLLIRANAISIQRYLNQFLLTKGYGSRGSSYGRVGTFSGTPESIKDLEQFVGMEFIQWLQKGLAEAAIMVNKPPLLAVPGGLLMSVDIFKLFARENPEFKNWQSVQNAFLALDFGKVTAEGEVLLTKYEAALPATVQVYNLTNGKRSPMSALELIHQLTNNFLLKQKNLSTDISSIPFLTKSGQWQKDPTPVSMFSNTFSPTTGMKNA